MQGGEWESCMAGGHQAGIAQRGGRGCPARPKLERARGCPGLCAGGAGHSARISGAVGGRRGPRGGGSSGGVPPPVQPPYTPRLRAVLPPPTVAERGRRRLAGAGGGGGSQPRETEPRVSVGAAARGRVGPSARRGALRGGPHAPWGALVPHLHRTCGWEQGARACSRGEAEGVAATGQLCRGVRGGVCPAAPRADLGQQRFPRLCHGSEH